MKRSALFLALLLVAAPALAAPKNYSSITTRSGQVFYDCKVVRVYPDGVSFTHRDGAAKIPLKDLPANLQREFPYDAKADAQYKREQAEARKVEKERARLREIAMEEKLMEAQMAEASYLAAASTAYAAPVAPMSTALPGEPAQFVSYQTPSWVGTPVSTSAFGGSGYRRGWGGYYPAGYGYGGYPYSGYSYPYGGYGYGYPSGGYGYPYSGYGYGGGYVRPAVFKSWNVGNGIRVGVGVSPFGGGIRLFR
ncbi:MAG: hypothetical protein ACO1TE_25380 [Prosthecobacter sp.]